MWGWHAKVHGCKQRRDDIRELVGMHGADVQYIGQSWVEIQHYAVAYFDCVIMFKVL